MNKWYIRQLNIWVESEDSAIWCEARQVAGILEKEGIAVCLTSGKEMYEDRIGKGGTQDLVQQSNAEKVFHFQETDGILWLTDSAEAARWMVDNRLPVIAWLHEGNRSDSFANVRYAVECPGELDADFFDRIFRRYAGIPWDILETDRCLVRETVVEDVDAFVRIYQDPEVTRYTEPFCKEPEAEREYVKEYIEKVYDFYGYGVWTVLRKESGEVIGRVGFEQADLPFLGYMIAPDWQGKGIAYEVCRAVLKFAREELGMETVRVQIDQRNLASVRLAEKLGFVNEKASLDGDTNVYVREYINGF